MSSYRTLIEPSAVYPGAGSGSQNAINYCLLGLADEVGELIGKWKKCLRGDDHALPPGILSPERRSAMLAEAGDVRWYLERLLVELGSTMDEIEAANVAKLMSRIKRGVLRGDGDNR